MNEDQSLKELFHRIELEISASDRLRAHAADHIDNKRSVRPVRRRLTWAGGFAGALTIAFGAFLLAPQSSVAGTLHRIEVALRDAKTMRIQAYIENKDHPKIKSVDYYYSDGQWRIDCNEGSAYSRSYIMRGGQQWLYMAATNVAIGEPESASFFPDGMPSALEFAKSSSDEGQILGDRTYRIEARPDLNGKPVYAIIGSRNGTPYHSEMIVDKRTDLPISVTFCGEEPHDPHYQVVTEQYQFNVPIDPREFSPKVNGQTRVLDLPSEAEKLKEAWAKPIRSIQYGDNHLDVRNIEVNRQGELFLACSYNLASDYSGRLRDTRLLPSSITDDLGRTYLSVLTTQPGGTFGDTHAADYMSFGKDRVSISEWAPALPTADWKSAKSFTVKCLNSTLIGYPTDTDDRVQATVQLAAGEPISTRFPAYSSALLLDYSHINFDSTISAIRAEAFEKKKQFGLAAYWYRDAAQKASHKALARRYEGMANRCSGQIAHDQP